MASLTTSANRVRLLTGVPTSVFTNAQLRSFVAPYARTVNGTTTYDINPACADVCDAWATRLATAVNFSADGASVDASDQAPALREAARAFRRAGGTFSLGTVARTDERR